MMRKHQNHHRKYRITKENTESPNQSKCSNQIEVIKNDFKISINAERNLKETKAIALIKQNPK